MNYTIAAMVVLVFLAGGLYGLFEARVTRRRTVNFIFVAAAFAAFVASYVIWSFEIRVIAGFWWRVFYEDSTLFPDMPRTGAAVLTLMMCVATLAGPYLAAYKPVNYWFMARRWRAIVPRLKDIDRESSRNE